MKSWLGTSGFQYPEWKGKFYPADLPASKMLAYYAARFSTTEVNYTFRRIPTATALQRWFEATPAEFKFSFKAPQKITHFAKLRNCAEVLQVFGDALAAVGEKLGVILFQLPPTFARDASVLQEFVRSIPQGLRAAFEFRHASWFADEVFDILRASNTALCIAESEDLASPMVATADFGYLRPRREDYSKTDIKRWAEFLQTQQQNWREAFIYFKHEEQGVGPIFAAQLADMLLPDTARQNR